MNPPRSWALWLLLEILITGGYWFAETSLSPLLPGVLPAPWQKLGWTLLHAVCQLGLWLGLLVPLTRARFLALYPNLGASRTRVIYLFAFPFVLIPLWVFLFWPRRQGDRLTARLPKFFSWGHCSGMVVAFYVPQILLLGLGFWHARQGRAPPVLSYGFSYLTAGPIMSQNWNRFFTKMERFSDLRKKMMMNPQVFASSRTRLDAYRELKIEDGFPITLVLAIDVGFVTKMKKSAIQAAKEAGDTNTRKDGLPKAKYALFSVEALEGFIGILELARSQKSHLSGFNPISAFGAGALELVQIRYWQEGIELLLRSSKITGTILSGMKRFEALRSKGALDPALVVRVDALRLRAEALFPGILKDLGGLPDSKAANSPEPESI